MRIRPQAAFIQSEWRGGLEIELAENGEIVSIVDTSLASDPFLLSPAFVNAHSHLEYRGMLGKLTSTRYWDWIREITQLKRTQSEDQVRADCKTAALENHQSGVVYIAEHSDRPFAAEAMNSVPIAGEIFQEVITVMEPDAVEQKLASIEANASGQRDFGIPVRLSPHAPYTVDEATLARLANQDKVSIHVAETPFETAFFREDSGPIADFYRTFHLPSRCSGESVGELLIRLGLAKPGVQWVHGCALEDAELAIAADNGVAIAHCPRSNRALACPPARVRQMLELGIPVGIGMDSAASSGSVVMLEELRAAFRVAQEIGEGLTPTQVWFMATTGGAQSLGVSNWEIQVGSNVPLIGIHATDPDKLLDEDSCPNIQFMTGARSFTPS